MREDLKGEITELRGMRFPFGMLIVIYHYTNYFSDYETTNWVLLEDLSFVLDFFFILSGVVMAHVYSDLSRFRYGKYINRRFFRIYPLHLLTFLFLAGIAFVGVKLGFTPSHPERYDFDTAWMHLTMVHAWYFDPVITFNVPSWSVSAEWFVYLIFPVFLVLKDRVSARTLLILAALTAAGWYAATLYVTGYSYPNLVGFALFRVVADFFLGFALREYLRTGSLPFTRFRHASRYYAVAMGSFGLLGFPPILGMTAFIWFVASAYERILAGRHDAFFDNDRFNRLGDVAFAQYITHMPFAIFATNVIEKVSGITLPGPSDNLAVVAIFLFLIAGSTFVAWVTHHFVEQPCAIYGPKLVEKGLFWRKRERQNPHIS